MRQGADVEAVDLSLYTPLHLAAECGMTDMVEFLARECDASVVAHATNGSVPLHFACHNNHGETALVLLRVMMDKGYIASGPTAFDDFKNRYSQTPLSAARHKGHTKLTEQLEAIAHAEQTWGRQGIGAGREARGHLDARRAKAGRLR